jgi:hypothetical protein
MPGLACGAALIIQAAESKWREQVLRFFDFCHLYIF